MKKIYYTILFLCFPFVSWAACTGSSPTWTSTPDRTSVASCVSQATAGDTINISAGTETWSSGVTINKSLTLSGAGETLTHINNSSTYIFYISLSSDVPVRITGLDINSDPNTGSDKHAIYIQGKLDGSFAYTKIRIDNNTFEKGKRAIYAYGWIEALIDHNEFLNCDIGVAVTGDNHDSWDRVIEAGTANAVFIEDNTFTQNNNSDVELNEAIYHIEGGRSVVRYNTFDLTAYTTYNSCPFDSHGNGSYYPSGYRGNPLIEVYNNDWYIHHSYRVFYFRGGSVIVYDNTITFETGTGAIFALSEEEGWQTAFFSPLDTAWPAEDQITNSFFWDNTLDGNPITDIYEWGGSLFYHKDRDYFMHAPESSGGYAYYSDRLGASGRGSDGTLVWDANHANAYYPYTAYTYPHPLSTSEPIISNPQPAEEIDCTSNPRSATLSIDTYQIATCKFDISDVAYASMGTEFSTTGGTTHTHTITDLPCDAPYAYYARCTDGVNTNSSSTLISFSIAPEGIPSECSGDDSFTGSNDDPPAASRWVNTGSDIQSNTLRVGHTDAGGQDYAVSSWATTGDIEVQVDFDVTGYPETNYWNLDFRATIDSTHLVSNSIKYMESAYVFERDHTNGGQWYYTSDPATNSTGKLKILRDGNTFSTYYRDGTGAWTQLGSPVTIGSANDPVYITLKATRGEGNPDFTGYFDNFQINTNCVTDEPVILTTSPAIEQECTPADPIDADIVVTTNEICECKKCVDGVGDCDADSTFNDAEMVAFNSTDAKTHTETDSLACDQTLKYRIICEDVGNVEMTANEDFSFFVASGGADSTPPVMSDLSPASTPNLTCITSSPRDVTASLKTNEIGTCKYSLDGDGGDDENTAYDDLNNTFSTTGGVTHSQLLSLACGASYTYWVRCQDDEGTPNQNTASGEITFTIDTAPPPPSIEGLTLTGTGVSGGSVE